MPLYVAYSLVPMQALAQLPVACSMVRNRKLGENRGMRQCCIPRVDYFILSYVKGQHVCVTVCIQTVTLCQYIFTHHQHTPCNYTVCCIEMQ